MARSQNIERNPDAAWRSRYSDLPSLEEVLNQQHPRVAARRPRVNPAERPPEPPKSTSKSDDDKREANAGSREKAGSREANAGSREKAGSRKAKAGSREKAGSRKAKAGSR
jgi:hypothetical protein